MPITFKRRNFNKVPLRTTNLQVVLPGTGQLEQSTGYRWLSSAQRLSRKPIFAQLGAGALRQRFLWAHSCHQVHQVTGMHGSLGAAH